MKCFEKKMSGFSIIYLHNPSTCYKCTQMAKYDEIRRTYENKFLGPRKKIARKKRNFINAPPVETITEPKSSEESEFEFRKPFDNLTLYPVKKIRVLKKKNFSSNPSQTFHVSSEDSPKKNSHEPTKKSNFAKSGKKLKVQETDQSTSGKQQCLKTERDKGAKVPGKGTLKRKRWFFDKLNDNDNYEDDMFADKKFGHFQNLLEDETDSSEQYEALQTPVFPFSISPRADSPSPPYKDCYSPSELNLSRKGAEEYHYRRGKRKKHCFPDNKNEAARETERRETNVEKTLEAVARILNERQNQIDKASDSDDDHYFSDVLDSSSKACS